MSRDIIVQAISQTEVVIHMSWLKMEPAEIVELKSYQALKKIKHILENDSLVDKECFMQIEEIVTVLEALGSDAGVRYDF